MDEKPVVDAVETVKGDNYIMQFEEEGLRLEIFENGDKMDDVFGELSKNMRLIPYEKITVTVFPVRKNPADKPVVHALLRINQTEDGFDEEGSVPYSEKLISVLKKRGVKVINDGLVSEKPPLNQKPEACFKIRKNLWKKITASVFFAACGLAALICGVLEILPTISMIFSGTVFAVSLFMGCYAVRTEDKIIFYKDYFTYRRGVFSAFYIHKKSIEAISIAPYPGGKKRAVAIFIPIGSVECDLNDDFYDYIKNNLKDYTRIFEE